MHHGYDQFDVAHPLPANFFLRYFNPTTVAHNPLVADPLVLTAIAFIILDRPEDALAEKTIALGFVRAVVDGFRLEHFAIGTLQNFIRRGQADGDAVKILILNITLLFEWHAPKGL